MATDAQNIVSEEVILPNEPVIEIEDDRREQKTEDIESLNYRFKTINGIYSNVLSPEIQKNEDLKRKQKKSLMNMIFVILSVQFIFTYIIVLAIVTIIAFSNQLAISDVIMNSLIKFVEFYITAIVAELISILYFIVKNVFDKSIIELFKDFDNNKSKKD